MRAVPATWSLALIRIGLGLYFLGEAMSKTLGNWWMTSRPLASFVHAQLPHAVPGYRDFLQGAVLPHALLFSRLTLLGEWSAGVLLLLGLATPMAALLVVWLNGNYLLTQGVSNPAYWINPLFMFLACVLLVSFAGRVLGVDSLLLRRLASRPGAVPGAGLPPVRYIHAPRHRAA